MILSVFFFCHCLESVFRLLWPLCCKKPQLASEGPYLEKYMLSYRWIRLGVCWYMHQKNTWCRHKIWNQYRNNHNSVFMSLYRPPLSVRAVGWCVLTPVQIKSGMVKERRGTLPKRGNSILKQYCRLPHSEITTECR